MSADRGTVEVILQLDPGAAAAAKAAGAVRAIDIGQSAVLRRAEELGAAIRPQHPDAIDPGLSGFFVAVVASQEEARSLIKTMLGMEGVEAAYIKPQPAMP